PRKEQGGAIQAVLDGRSELKPRKEGQISGAFGFRMGASLIRDIQGGEREARPFDDVYGDGWAPEVQFLYEYQPWHSETWGNFGFIGSFGLSFFNGFGRFKHQLINENVTPAVDFPIQSQTRFNFFQVPVMVGGVIRLNTLRYIRPFVMAGPMGIAFFESRNDDKSGSRGFSKALFVSAGISIPLDWLSSTSSWDLYRSFGIHQYYLTIDYSKVTTIASEVSFDVSGASAGLTFEF
ncbi:MAG TPA: hypothetical protein VM598_10230, partial [Bdellovibrionota bacterium]|nr:hypothetical protein [Bdellovibrionota bacterium]